MYHYFENKESLLRPSLDYGIRILTEKFEAVLEGYPPTERVAGILMALFESLSQDSDYWALFYMLRAQSAVKEILRDSSRYLTFLLRNMFADRLRAMGWP